MSRATAIARRELEQLLLFAHRLRRDDACSCLPAASHSSSDFQPGQPAAMRSIFDWMVWFLVARSSRSCSMGLLAQEWATGTIETLMTAPVGEADVVARQVSRLARAAGRDAGPDAALRRHAAASTAGRTSGRSSAAISASCWSAALFISVGLFCSSLTRSQIVAAVASACDPRADHDRSPGYVGSKASLPAFWRGVVDQMVFKRYTDFSKGVLDVGQHRLLRPRDGRLPVRDGQGP